jgi:hypothetical protein
VIDQQETCQGEKKRSTKKRKCWEKKACKYVPSEVSIAPTFDTPIPCYPADKLVEFSTIVQYNADERRGCRLPKRQCTPRPGLFAGLLGTLCIDP